MLPLTVQLVRLAVPALIPPPLEPAELPLTVQLVRFVVVALMPPPLELPEVLPLIVQLVSSAVVARIPPPPEPLVLRRTVLSWRVSVLPPTTQRPPPKMPETLRATVVRTSLTFPVPGAAPLEIPPPVAEARFPLTAQSRTTRSAFPT